MDEQDIIYMAELEFGHNFVEDNYTEILNSTYEELSSLFEEYKQKKEM